MATHAVGIWDTELGKALKPVIPEATTRIIIDISYDDVVRVYYECHAGESLLNIDWPGAFREIGVSVTQAPKSEGIKDG